MLTTPETAPMTTAQTGATMLHDAVMPTKPAMTPLIVWPTLARFSKYDEKASAARPPAAAARLVLRRIRGTRSVSPIALPPLKPNQQNQRIKTPIVAIGRLCGAID